MYLPNFVCHEESYTEQASLKNYFLENLISVLLLGWSVNIF